MEQKIKRENEKNEEKKRKGTTMRFKYPKGETQ